MLFDITTILDSQASKYKFMKGLLCLSLADNNLSEEEKEYFKAVSMKLGMNSESIESFVQILGDTKISSDDIIFVAREQALLFIRESLQLCYLDGHYDNKEKALLKKIGKQNNINMKTINTLEKWVKKTIILQEEGFNLLEEL